MSDDVLQAATWRDVAPLLERWQIGVWPSGDGTWELVRPAPPGGDLWEVLQLGLPFAALPQAIADVAARCAADVREETP